MLISASVPRIFWGEAVLTAVHLINRIPTALTASISPHERLYRIPPDYSSLRVFGCTCFVMCHSVDRGKIDRRSIMCVFLGYSDTQKGYRCYDPLSRKLYVSRNVVFLERIPLYLIPDRSQELQTSDLISIFPFIEDPQHSPSDESTTETHYEVAPQVPPIETTPRYPQRTRRPPQKLGFSNSCYSAAFASSLTTIHGYSELTSYKKVSLDPLWCQAMDDELSALHRTKTWDLVPLPPGKHAVSSRWVSQKKTQSDGSVESRGVVSKELL